MCSLPKISSNTSHVICHTSFFVFFVRKIKDVVKRNNIYQWIRTMFFGNMQYLYTRFIWPSFVICQNYSAIPIKTSQTINKAIICRYFFLLCLVIWTFCQKDSEEKKEANISPLKSFIICWHYLFSRTEGI